MRIYWCEGACSTFAQESRCSDTVHKKCLLAGYHCPVSFTSLVADGWLGGPVDRRTDGLTGLDFRLYMLLFLSYFLLAMLLMMAWYYLSQVTEARF